MLLYLLIPLLNIILCMLYRKLAIFNAALILIYYSISHYDVIGATGNWIDMLGNLNINWELKIDNISNGILFPILLINFLVQLFSAGYMSSDPHQNRYNLYLNFFVLVMVLLVLADNLFVLFVGWEGVGLASYLLINYWYTRIYANLAGIKAFLMNRIGDWGLTLGIIFFWLIYGSFSIDMQNINNGSMILGLGILTGAITKSAQIGLHSWLARSMEGPTPVSALLHAATMVTAGVYLLLRMHILIEWSNNGALIICWIGGLSALAGAIGGLAEQDIKKIIAYSTISQLGYMFIAIGFFEYNLSLWHLINHACFKALLFLSAGALIHNLFGHQDIRKFGNIPLPLLAITFLIGNLSIMAIPFMTGWWTKDQILLEIFKYNSFMYLLIYLAAIITAAYSIKLFLCCFNSRSRLSNNNYNSIHTHIESSMTFGLIVLIFCAIYLGYLTSNFTFFDSYNMVAVIDNNYFVMTIYSLFILFIIFISRKLASIISIIPILDQIDIIYLRLMINIVAPCSAYLYRNYQGFLETLFGGLGAINLIEIIAFRFE